MEQNVEQLKVAYALNLCTVSVSQIIDYDDINIMDQEYEAILNNLNLEEMPKDAALLNILNQILNTINSFRLQEGEKEFVEQEYQLRLKNAMWSAVPNLGLIITGGNPIIQFASLASQVGIGYMNYRKEKASALYTLEKGRWQLQRSALEQFSNLRRELFNTAWKLSETYEYADELRLTERQIEQYNAILMDDDVERKYERLKSIKEHFYGYPPFWYFLGNAANELSSVSDDPDYYRQEAINNYDTFLATFSQSNLLRENQLASACALEYIDLLPCKTDKDITKIKGLADFAVKMSGGANDVMQLCVFPYIRINDVEKASEILRHLVNEGYNTVLNSQLLSGIYVNQYLKGDNTAERKYQYLKNRIDDKYLFPFPQQLLADGNNDETAEEVQKTFFENQKDILAQKYDLVIKLFQEKYRILFNKCIPVPGGKEYADNYYDGSAASYEARRADGVILRSIKNAKEYVAELQECDYPYNLLPVLNDMMNAVSKLNCVQGREQALLSCLSEKMLEKREGLIRLHDRLEDGTRFMQDNYYEMLNLSFETFTDTFFDLLTGYSSEFIDSKTDLLSMNEAEIDLIDFCNDQWLETPEELYRHANDIKADPVLQKPYLGPELIDEGILSSAVDDKFNTVLKIIEENKDDICAEGSTSKMLMCKSDEFDRYFINAYFPNKQEIRKKTVAILDDQSKKDRDLLFTTEGLMQVYRGRLKTVVLYDDVEVNSDETHLLLHWVYINDQIDMKKLIDTVALLRTKPFEISRRWNTKEMQARIIKSQSGISFE